MMVSMMSCALRLRVGYSITSEQSRSEKIKNRGNEDSRVGEKRGLSDGSCVWMRGMGEEGSMRKLAV